MTKKKRQTPKSPAEAQPDANPVDERVEETPFEAVASICSILVIGLFILTFLGQNYVIPSGSMENTLLIGDHLLVDRITLAPPTKWMPLIHSREPQRGDIVVFIKPVPDPDANGNPQYLTLVKRLIAVPGDRIHLRDGVVILNGVAQSQPHAQPTTPENYSTFLDEFPAEAPPAIGQVPDSWAMIELPKEVQDSGLQRAEEHHAPEIGGGGKHDVAGPRGRNNDGQGREAAPDQGDDGGDVVALKTEKNGQQGAEGKRNRGARAHPEYGSPGGPDQRRLYLTEHIGQRERQTSHDQRAEKRQHGQDLQPGVYNPFDLAHIAAGFGVGDIAADRRLKPEIQIVHIGRQLEDENPEREFLRREMADKEVGDDQGK